jgi:hypothetical protein
MLIQAIRMVPQRDLKIQKFRRNFMNTIRRLFQIRALMLAALVMTSFPCAAQSYSPAKAGSFTLTTETHWGLAVLPAGDYTFKVDTSSFPMVVVQSVYGTTAALIFPESQSMPDQSAKSGLAIETKDGETYVKSLYVADVGLVFNYGLHKKKPLRMAKLGAPPATYSIPAK